MKTKSKIVAVALASSFAFATLMAGSAHAVTPARHDGGGGGGGFAVRCEFSHTDNVDPIVMPGKKMVSHSHKFFGNTTTDENSTGASLLAGNSTCEDPNNLSAYWVPALYQDGIEVDPIRVKVGYGALRGEVTAFPNGFMALTGKSDDTARWGCQVRGQRPIYTSSAANVPTCTGSEHLVAEIIFGECWDGASLDSADHRSHLANSERVDMGRSQCPSTHPVRVPRVSVEVEYPQQARGGSGITLASGAASTLHADIFEAWVSDSLQAKINESSGQRQQGPRGNDGQANGQRQQGPRGNDGQANGQRQQGPRGNQTNRPARAAQPTQQEPNQSTPVPA
jgi:hypothetical protein